MSAKIEVPAPFSPLLKLDLPSPEEYNKRKVALISGEWYCALLLRPIVMKTLRELLGITGQDGSYL